MDITRFAIEHKRVTYIFLVVLLVAGTNAFFTLPQAEDPGFLIRTAMIQTFFPGASPERVEFLVTDKLETKLLEMPEVDAVNSTSKTGLSVVTVDLKDEYSDLRPIWDKMRRKVDDAVAEMPEGIVGPFVNDDFGDVFGTLIALTGDGYGNRELRPIAVAVRDMLLRQENTGRVELHGVQEERVFFEFSNSRLSELGLTVTDLSNILRARNIVMPGGNILLDGERIEMEPSGNFDTIDQLRRSVISVPGRADLLYLEDIGEVRRGYRDPPQSLLSSSGEPALLIAVSLKDGGNIVALGEEVSALVADLNVMYPIGVNFEIVAYQAGQVVKKVDDFTLNVVQAIGIVLAVMLVMLGLRTGLVVASLIPCAMLTTIFVMSLMGLSLNQMTLAALIIALGMLVDNAIVMSESVMVKLESGLSAFDAAINSARELRIPLLTSSLTTAAAFLPIYLAEGSMGEYTGVLFTVVTTTLLASWVLSLTVIPVFCVSFLKVKPKDASAQFGSIIYRLYRALLVPALRIPLVAVSLAVLIFFVALKGFDYIPNIFFPPSDRPMFTAELQLPIGTAIETSQEMIAELDHFVATEFAVGESRADGVSTWTSYVGSSPPRFTLATGQAPPSPEYNFMLFNVTSLDLMADLMARLEDYASDRYPSLVATIKPLQLGAPIDHPIEVRISGVEAAEVFDIVDDVKAKIAELDGTKNIVDDWGQRSKKIEVDINGPRSRRSGVTNQDIAVSLQSVLSGYKATDYREGDQIIPVTIRSVDADRKDLGKLESLNVFSQATGQSVPLSQVADLHVAWQPAKILRRNHLKTVKVSADLEPGITAADIDAVLMPWLAEQQPSWPVGYGYEVGGEYEQSQDSSAAVGAKLPIGGLIIILLLVSQFDSVRRAAIILLTIPLGIIGVVIGLIVAKSYFGFMTLLGVISLAGIVINNAIVLIDRIDTEINDNGLVPTDAIVEASQQRLRPILLTTLTTLGGMLPMWLGGGPMWEPMAIAIIFGLLFATVLTLGLVPVLYSLFFRVSFSGFRYRRATS